MKHYIFILPIAFAFACTQSKFKGGTPAYATAPIAGEKTEDSIPRGTPPTSSKGTDTISGGSGGIGSGVGDTISASMPKPATTASKGTDTIGGGGSSGSGTGDTIPAKDPKLDGTIPTIPDNIYAVKKFGANFEDYNDADYNDAVLCFKGDFELNTMANTIVSLKDQDVKPVTFSSGDCHHDITVEVFSASGPSTYTQTFPSRPFSETDVNPPANAKVVPSLLKFKKGDKLEIKMKVVNGVCDVNVERSMRNKVYSRLLPDVCYGDY